MDAVYSYIDCMNIKKFNINPETIDSRTSVRSYSGQPLNSADRRLVESAIASFGPCPFGTRPRLMLVEPGTEGELGSGRIGTYGIIQNAPAFIVGATTPGPFVFADFGYALEWVILAATANDLGTCWLGGTFDRSRLMETNRMSDEEIIPAVTPIGEPSERRTLVDSAMRLLAGSRRRHPWTDLFFNGTWNRPLEEADAGVWAVALSAVRAGPSASNKQPWRIVRTGRATEPEFHLFLDEDKPYNNVIRGVRIQEIDIGIAMRHFEVAALSSGLSGSWRRLEEPPVSYAAPLQYYASWQIT